jgi:hypothetical protein
MKKLLIVVVMIVFGNILSGAQEVPCRVLETSPYYYQNSYNYTGDLQYGEIVYTKNSGGYNPLAEPNGFSTFKIRIIKDNEEYMTYAKNLAPFGVDSLFSTNIAITYEQLVINDSQINLPNEMWVPAYYCEVLTSKNRETLTKFEPHLLEYNTGDIGEYGIPMQWYLHSFTHIRSGMYMFYNSRIYAGDGSNFLIKNIIKTEYGYIVTCFGPKEVQVNAGPSFDWSAYPGGEVNLLLYVDGEYIDMYFNDTEHKFGTLVRVREEFIRRYESLMETNTCDLTNVVWPRRADKQIEAGKPYRTAEILKLHVSEDRNSETIMEMPENTAVLVLETGAEDTIDGIKANWVKVRLADGREGWCFGGYLLADIPVESAGAQQTSRGVSGQEGRADQEEDAAAGSQPAAGFPWVVMAIIAGIALVGITAFVVILRKKR